MARIITKCGYCCDLCLAYKQKLEAHPLNKQILSDGWHKYFDFRIGLEDIYCDGCLSKDGKLIDNSCPVRPCVIKREIDNCVIYEDYICEKLQTRMVRVPEIQAKFNQTIPTKNRERFIKSYENENRLITLHLKK